MASSPLDSYRISKALSSKLRVVTLLAVLAVLWVHAYNLTSRFNLTETATDMRSAPGSAGFVEYLISQTFARWPVAMLFAISGFLFFHNLQPRWDDYRRKYAGRLRTVVLPFVLWSAISLLMYVVLQALPQSSAYFSSDFLQELSAGRILDKLFLHPLAYPLWFLQTLMVCFALAPLLYWPARALRWLTAVPFAALWVFAAPVTEWTSWRGLTFFTLGAVIALERRRGVELTPAPWLGKAIFPLWLLACVLYTAFLRGDSAFWVQSLHKAVMCLAVAAIWFGYETYLRPLEGSRLVTLLLPFTFFIFAGQEPLMTIVKRLGLHALGPGVAPTLVVYFATPVLTLIVIIAVAAPMRRYLPAPFAWLTGGRGTRGARVAKAAAGGGAAAEAAEAGPASSGRPTTEAAPLTPAATVTQTVPIASAVTVTPAVSAAEACGESSQA